MERGEDDKPVHRELRLLRDFKMSVEIASVKAEVFAVEDESSEDRACGYIVSEEGALFTVVLHDDRPIRDRDQWYKATLYLDVRDTPDTVRPFMFSKIQLTEEVDGACNDPEFVRGLGSIKITLHRVRDNGRVPVNPYGERPPQPFHQKQINEKLKKASLSHQTARGQPIANPQRYSRTRDKLLYLDPRDSPQFTGELYYRSRELLELNGIIQPVEPGTPEPEKEVLVISDDDGANDAEKRARVKRELRSVKPEPETLTID